MQASALLYFKPNQHANTFFKKTLFSSFKCNKLDLVLSINKFQTKLLWFNKMKLKKLLVLIVVC